MGNMLITSSEQLRELTGSFYANSDFDRIRSIVQAVEDEVADIIGREMMEQLIIEAGGSEGSISIETDDGGVLTVNNKEITVEDGNVIIGGYCPYGLLMRVEDGVLYVSNAKAVRSCQQAVAYMSALRYYRLNDISHEDMGRKVKIDRDNEARPFEWQLARDDRMHLEEYYRALDRTIRSLEPDPRFQATKTWQRKSALAVADADTLSALTGLDNSPWLFLRMIPYIDESQHFVQKAYGTESLTDKLSAHPTSAVAHAAQMAVALGALALMGRRTSLQTLPYGLMKLFESNGGGNRQEAAAIDRLDEYLKHLSRQQHYWINEMKQLRDEETGEEKAMHLQMPENDSNNKYMRV